MNNRFSPTILSLLFLAVLVLSACKKKENGLDENTSDLDPALELAFFESYQLMDSVQLKFQEFAGNDNGDVFVDVYQTMEEVRDWAESKEAISQAFVTDTTYLKVRFESGFEYTLRTEFTNIDGSSLFRGAGVGDLVELGQRALSDCDEELENKSVLFYIPFTSEFEYTGSTINDYRNLLEGAGLDIEVDVLTDEECTIDAFENIGDYGVVILDTHGNPDATHIHTELEYGGDGDFVDQLTFKETTIAQIGADAYRSIIFGDIGVDFKAKVVYDDFDWFLDEELIQRRKGNLVLKPGFIRELGSLQNTIIFNNSCMSGWSQPTGKYPDPIAPAYLDLDPIAYYSWARPNNRSHNIANDSCKAAEEGFLNRLVDSDCSGEWHLKTDGTFWFNFPGLYPNPQARITLTGSSEHLYPAPCEASSLTDARDGTEYVTVCIGEQTWMAENLRYDGAGVCAFEDATNCADHGRLYSLPEVLEGGSTLFGGPPVQGICPQGWHVPSVGEWQELIDYCGGFEQALIKLRGADAWIDVEDATDEFGFDLKPHIYTLSVNNGEVISRTYPDETSIYGTRLWSSGAEYGLLSSVTANVYDGARAFQMGYNLINEYQVNTDGSLTYAPDTDTQDESFEYAPCRCIKN